MKPYTLLLLFCLKFGNIDAQRTPTDSLYQKNSLAIEFGNSLAIDINHPRYEGFNRMTLSNRLAVTYFFAKRWSVNSGITYTIFSSNRPDLRPKQNYWRGDLSVRYHVRKFYFGVATSYGNDAITIYNDVIRYPPRQKLVVYGNIGLHRQISQHKKFWKNTFFVIDLKVGPALYTEYKSDGLSKNTNNVGGHIGLHYIIKPKAKKPKTE